MKRSSKPVRAQGFELRNVNNELQLYKAKDNTALYINESAAMIWQLCDGEMKVEDITSLLKDSYPDAAEMMDKDVKEVLAMLKEHGAISH